MKQIALLAVLVLVTVGRVEAACPSGAAAPITSGTGAAGLPVVFSFSDGPINAAFFLLGDGDRNNSGTLATTDWLERLGDLDGDGRIEYRLRAPGEGPGGWGDPRTIGCPATAASPYPPLVVILSQPREDLDRDGLFDVFEDINHNRQLDFGEDRDFDGRLTGPNGCEGVTREDQDCDGHLDVFNEDLNGNGVLDPGEDRDGDGRLDLVNEDRNHDQVLNDRPLPQPSDVMFEVLPDGTHRPLPPYYPYTSFRPAPGGLVVASVAWNGSAYDFDAINSPARTITGTDGTVYRAIDASLRENVFGFRVTSARVDYIQSAERFRLEPSAPARVDDAGGQRVVFDRFAAALQTIGFPQPSQHFLETGTTAAEVPMTGGFLSVAPVPNGVVASLEGGIRSSGSDAFLQGLAVLPTVRVKTLDQDMDTWLLPYDICPTVPASIVLGFQPDANLDGVGDACDPTLDPLAIIDHSWTTLVTSVNPGERRGAAAAYDASRGVIVLFGGSDDTATWEYDGTTWTSLQTPLAPDARAGHRMVYDDTNRRVLLFGGTRFAGGALNDLWQYTASSWRRIDTPITPPPQSPETILPGAPVTPSFGMTYDSAHRLLVLFGGRADGRTWVFDDKLWRVAPSPRSPLPRNEPQMVYDPVRQLTVLHGGIDLFQFAPSPRLFNDTWEFDGAVWQPVDAQGDLPPNWGGATAYDPVRRRAMNNGGVFERLILNCSPFGGCTLFRVFQPGTGTRVYDGTGWSIVPTRPTGDSGEGIASAYDGARDRMFVYGGDNLPGRQAEYLQPVDDDGDGIESMRDNCPLAANPDQADGDHDGFGDVCDNCPGVANPTQRDLDRDHLGDACDDDIDGDGVANRDDACPASYVDGRPSASIGGGGGPDSDGDGIADDCDACPHDPANDADRDGICGDVDNCPTTFNPLQDDTNHDGSGDACQPTLFLGNVQQDGGSTLEVMARAFDPNGDLLSGSIEFFEHDTFTLRTLDPSSPNPCATDAYPPGTPGVGIGYFANPEGGAVLFDIDSQLGEAFPGLVCSDGQPDYATALGTCNSPLSGPQLLLTVYQAPTVICIGRFDPRTGDFLFGTPRTDLTVVAMDAQTIQLLNVLRAPSWTIPFSSGLPQTSPLANLLPGVTYRMIITVTDGSTVPVTAEAIVLYQGEQQLVIDDGQRVTDLGVDLKGAPGKGSWLVSWRTTGEFYVRGFNVVEVDNKGNHVRLNPVLIPCQECVTGLGADYATVVPKHKSGKNIFVDMLLTDGTVRTFGPARP